MKITFALLSTVLMIALTLPMLGQDNHDNKANMQKYDMSKMMGKPTVDATVEGLHMKVWLMTQKQHKKMMNGKMGQMMMDHDMMGMKDTSMGMGKDMKGMNHDGMGMGKNMNGMKHEGMGMDSATREAMMAGTHHIMLEVTDATSGKEIASASAKVMIVSPSKKRSSVDLKPAMSCFGDGITLDEKGEYQLTVSVNVNGVFRTKEFQYMVK